VSADRLSSRFFRPYACAKTGTLVFGQAEGDSGVQDAPLVRSASHTHAHAHAHAHPYTWARHASQVRELLHDLMVIALGGGGGDWVECLAQIGGRSTRKVEGRTPNPKPHPQPSRAPNPHQVDLLMFGDFGKDQDDEKALAMAVMLPHAQPQPEPSPPNPNPHPNRDPNPTLPLPLPLPQVTLQHAGCLQRISVISNLGDSKMRARLAKGTLNVLEARDDATQPRPRPRPYACPNPDPHLDPNPYPDPTPHQARDTEVAVGSDGGRAGDTIHEYEFAGCAFLPLALP
jgi:hypothetical protein